MQKVSDRLYKVYFYVYTTTKLKKFITKMNINTRKKKLKKKEKVA